jgi:hypothetical protein
MHSWWCDRCPTEYRGEFAEVKQLAEEHAKAGHGSHVNVQLLDIVPLPEPPEYWRGGDDG